MPMRNDIFNMKFKMTLSGTIFSLKVYFNVRMNRWLMNISDSQANQILVGVPILIQRSLTSQYPTLALPAGQFICTDDTGLGNQPTQYSFGQTNTLYYLDPDA